MMPILSIVVVASSAVYSLPSSVNSNATFRFGFFRACIEVAPPGWELNSTMECASYSQLQSYANSANITDFSSPSALSAAQAFSILGVISLGIQLAFIILLVRSSQSTRILLFLSASCIWTLVDTLLALLCLLESSSSLVLMYGGAFLVFICISMALEAAAALLFAKIGQKFGGICSSADLELVRKLSRL